MLSVPTYPLLEETFLQPPSLSPLISGSHAMQCGGQTRENVAQALAGRGMWGGPGEEIRENAKLPGGLPRTPRAYWEAREWQMQP